MHLNQTTKNFNKRNNSVIQTHGIKSNREDTLSPNSMYEGNQEIMKNIQVIETQRHPRNSIQAMHNTTSEGLGNIARTIDPNSTMIETDPNNQSIVDQ